MPGGGDDAGDDHGEKKPKRLIQGGLGAWPGFSVSKKIRHRQKDTLVPLEVKSRVPSKMNTFKRTNISSLSRNKKRGCNGRLFNERCILIVTVSFACLMLLGNIWLYWILNDAAASAAAAPGDTTMSVQVHQKDKSQQRHHLAFSTSCSFHSFKQDWQSYLFFHSALRQNQPGTVTRIVSGCDEEQKKAVQEMHDEKIATMSDRFHVHFTPEFGKVEGASYQATKYWNKPFSVHHWMKNVFGYSPGQTHTEHDDDIIIIVDPDMLLQRPLVNNFTGYPLDFWGDRTQKFPDLIRSRVEHGHPIAQDYSFGAAWLTNLGGNLTYVVGPDSPVHNVSESDANALYSAGPPYMLTARDMYLVSDKWCDFLPRMFELHPQMMAEMYGYSMAVAHLGLKHQIAKGMMISNVGMNRGEGWYFLDNASPEEVCGRAQDSSLPNRPHMLHYCQRYSIGDFFQSKYKTHHEFLTCEQPLMRQPPRDAAARYNYSHYGDGSFEQYDKISTRIGHAYMVCTILAAFNQAATYFKQNHCPAATANYNQTWNFFEDEKERVRVGKAKQQR
jgi:hypothetical protein